MGVLAAFALVATSQASVYSFNWNKSQGGSYDGVGTLNSISSTFNSVTNRLTWNFNIGSASNPNASNGFWLVLSPGPNPKGYSGELAIMYFDASKSVPTLTSFAYNGVNGPDSFLHATSSNSSTPDFIMSSIGKNKQSVLGLTNKTEANGSKTMGFDIDASIINGHTPKYPGGAPWTGAAYGSKVGVWFHPVKATFGYGSGGALCNLNVSKQGWFDGQNFPTTQAVPEPTTMALLAAGSIVASRRRKKK